MPWSVTRTAGGGTQGRWGVRRRTTGCSASSRESGGTRHAAPDGRDHRAGGGRPGRTAHRRVAGTGGLRDRIRVRSYFCARAGRRRAREAGGRVGGGGGGNTGSPWINPADVPALMRAGSVDRTRCPAVSGCWRGGLSEDCWRKLAAQQNDAETHLVFHALVTAHIPSVYACRCGVWLVTQGQVHGAVEWARRHNAVPR